MTTVREFAERVLFGETLADKLAPPPAAGLEDLARGPALVTPEGPGRPRELRLDPDGVRAEFPGVARIEDEGERGRLLHFFANHELLATELMALVLLKFPDAPAEFRAGVLKTLKEEQMHTKLYMRRMEACGVEFGELPVNGFFWNLVAPMNTPLDYVTRLSLTFEQANLDYARGYSRVFSNAGDPETAGILDRIYHDEINHVHYGLTWFRKWREGRSDWKSFCSLMQEPLSAARAKGAFEFNEAGRREAGLDEEFIRELRVFSRSKGRTPDVYWFNPEAEDELAGNRASAPLVQASHDLEMVMVALAKADDVVMLNKVPSLEHRERLQEFGVVLPELVEWSDQEKVAARKLQGVRPWAASPGACARAQEFGVRQSPVGADKFSKLKHAELLGKVLRASDWEVLCDEGDVGRPVGSVEDVEAIRRSGKAACWVVKAPVSTAGRDRMLLSSEGDLSGADERRLAGMFRRSAVLLMEPWLDRVLDFSIQYEMTDDGLRNRGMVVLENCKRGQFRSAMAVRRPFDSLGPKDRRALHEGGDGRGRWGVWLEELLEPALGTWLGDYRGPLGVDAFLYRDEKGGIRLKPVVEVNPRYTMGRVAVEFARDRRNRQPVRLVIQSVESALPPGGVALTEVLESTRLVAYLVDETVSGKR
ncbi:DUF455 family protein [Haloferula rosea]|uniref:DUF455 family protein n=1 Tax=Haloferula rosea TaxID=490093 RepID=A0A934VH72_9BACT|nr:DUF455 family protein [Haloferula rosea]MBK1828350.1 DUF455 family protein [Haloferula rosea]